MTDTEEKVLELLNEVSTVRIDTVDYASFNELKRALVLSVQRYQYLEACIELRAKEDAEFTIEAERYDIAHWLRLQAVDLDKLNLVWLGDFLRHRVYQIESGKYKDD